MSRKVGAIQLPVADLVSGLAHLMFSEAALEEQFTKIADNSPISATRHSI